jgi:hypothetical protein
MTSAHARTRRQRYAPRTRGAHARTNFDPRTIPPLPDGHASCLCPGCYWVATEASELCLRCEMTGCNHEENNHG